MTSASDRADLPPAAGPEGEAVNPVTPSVRRRTRRPGRLRTRM